MIFYSACRKNRLFQAVFGSMLNIFQKCYFRERKIFSSVWLHYENCSRKYFHVFGNILKMLFSTTTHTKPTTTQQENHQNTTTHTTTTTIKKIRDQREKVKIQNHKNVDQFVGRSKSHKKSKSHREISSWAHGAKALGCRRSPRLVG